MTSEPHGGPVTLTLSQELGALKTPRHERVAKAVLIAALQGVPWVGGVAAVAGQLGDAREQTQVNELLQQWLEVHEDRLRQLVAAVKALIDRVEEFGDEGLDRLESPEFLLLVRKAFRVWDEAETEEKRTYVGNLISNAAGSQITSDDIVRLFIDWVQRYHESHFRIIRYVYQNRGCTRRDIGVALFGRPLPADTSADADLFRELFRELNLGGIVRAQRETTDSGDAWKRKQPVKRSGPRPDAIESSFEATKPQELTALGDQFVHYTLGDVARRLGPRGAD